MMQNVLRPVPTLTALFFQLLLLTVGTVTAEDTGSGLTSHSTYTKWLNHKGNDYTGSKLFKGESGGKGLEGESNTGTRLALHWVVDSAKSSLRIGVAAEAAGWVGLGFSEMGGMKGSDIVFFEASGSRVFDAYATGSARPKIDEQQDWKLISSIAEDGLIIFEVERKLDTGDTMDWPITDDSDLMFPGTKLIAAWGDTDEMRYHGPDQRLQGTARFFGDSKVDEEAKINQQLVHESEGSIVMQANHIAVPATKGTTYVHRCFRTSEFVKEQGLPLKNPLHIVGFEWLIDHRDLIHHISLYSSPLVEVKKCDETGPHSLFYTWGKGTNMKFAFPDDVGIMLAMGEGPSTGGLGEVPKSFRLEIHYENTKHIKGIKDSSGVRIHYSSKLRKHTAGVMELGDPRVFLRAKLIGEGLQRHLFQCPQSCTNRYIQEGGLTVLYEMLHMHKHGVTMQNIQKRGGKEIRRSSVQYYDFDQAGAHLVKQTPFQMLPGDSFDTICNYNGTKDLIFGSSSSQEMCLVYVVYYPASDVHLSCSYKAEEAGCEAEYSSAPVETITLLSRWFGEKQDQIMLPSTTISNDPIHGGRVQILSLDVRVNWPFVIILCVLVCALVFYAACRRNAMTAAYKKVATGEDEDPLEGGGMNRDNRYQCPPVMQTASSKGMRRRLPLP